MTDIAYAPTRRYAVQQQFWPLRHFAEVAAFIIILCISIRLPSIGKFMTLGWLAMLGLLILAYRVELSRVLLRWWPLLLAPLIAALSFLWSDIPSTSVRYGLQLFLTAFAAVLVARTMPPSRFVAVLSVALLTFAVLSILSGRQGASATGTVLIGLVGSKNQISWLAYVLMVSALTTVLNRNVPPVLRMASLPGVAIGAYLVATTDSATAMLITAASLGLFIPLWILSPLKPAGRAGLILALVIVSLPILALLPEINRAISDFMINVLHKDPGMTGRSYLWERASALIAQRPLLGYGFQGFWLSNSPDAVGLLLRFGQTDGRVFNFHNTYLQFAVDAGLVGATIVAGTFAAALIALARRYVMSPTVTMTFLLVFFLVTVARSFTEVLLVAFSSQTFFLFVALTYAFWRPTPGWDEDEQPVAHASGVVPYSTGPYPIALQSVQLQGPFDSASRG